MSEYVCLRRRSLIDLAAAIAGTYGRRGPKPDRAYLDGLVDGFLAATGDGGIETARDACLHHLGEDPRCTTLAAVATGHIDEPIAPCRIVARQRQDGFVDIMITKLESE